MGCNLCAWACPYGARELDEATGTMKKCTLCVDRIYDEMLAPEDRQPACVLACPTHARMFGDLDDPESEVSRVTAERGGFALLPELGLRPVNRYLPPRQPKSVLSDKDERALLDRGLASLASPVIRR
jgi:Fe-S-cluster-containing dehydrogenase component